MMVATSKACSTAPVRSPLPDFLMDYLKSRAPFWKKKEITEQGAEWVSAKDSDEDGSLALVALHPCTNILG